MSIFECELVYPLLTLSQRLFLNSLPNDKILDLLKLKSFANDKINVTKKLKFVLGRVENTVEKGENACHTMFSKGLLYRVIKSRNCVVKS